MEFFFRTIQAVSGFVLGIFGASHPDPEPELISVPSSYEVSATTTVAVSEATTTTKSSEPVTPTKKTETSATVAAKVTIPTSVPSAPSVAPVVTPTSAPTNVQARSSSSGAGSSIAQPTKLSIEGGSLKKVSEKDAIKLKALLTMSDGSTKDVTSEAKWEVIGPIGSIQGGVFTAKLELSVAEFGRAPGAIHATFTDSLSKKEFTADTGIFDVAAFVPVIDIGGQ